MYKTQELSHSASINFETKGSWNLLSANNAELRAKLTSITHYMTTEQADASMQHADESALRDELTASLARETAWKSDLQMTYGEVLQFVNDYQLQRLLFSAQIGPLRHEPLGGSQRHEKHMINIPSEVDDF